MSTSSKGRKSKEKIRNVDSEQTALDPIKYTAGHVHMTNQLKPKEARQQLKVETYFESP
jgi:hypothetical protein